MIFFEEKIQINVYEDVIRVGQVLRLLDVDLIIKFERVQVEENRQPVLIIMQILMF